VTAGVWNIRALTSKCHKRSFWSEAVFTVSHCQTFNMTWSISRSSGNTFCFRWLRKQIPCAGKCTSCLTVRLSRRYRSAVLGCGRVPTLKRWQLALNMVWKADVQHSEVQHNWWVFYLPFKHEVSIIRLLLRFYKVNNIIWGKFKLFYIITTVVSLCMELHFLIFAVGRKAAFFFF
jgi:hypothetical protein